MKPRRPVGDLTAEVDAPASELDRTAARMPRNIVRRAIRIIPMVVGSERVAALPQMGDALNGYVPDARRGRLTAPNKMKHGPRGHSVGSSSARRRGPAARDRA